MKEFIDKLIERLREQSKWVAYGNRDRDIGMTHRVVPFDKLTEIVNELAEEYINTSTEHINCSTDTSTISKMENVCWIPCSERLPKVSNWYLITVSEPHETFILYFDTYDNDWTDFNCITIKNVIAWQPLPAPFTEGE